MGSRILPQDARRAAHSAALLASNHDGEVVAAARAFVGILAKAGLEPRAVVTAGLAGGRSFQPMPNCNPAPHAPAKRPWRERALMARYSPHLTDWERNFLDDVVAWSSLSARQEAALKAILVKSEGRRS